MLLSNLAGRLKPCCTRSILYLQLRSKHLTLKTLDGNLCQTTFGKRKIIHNMLKIKIKENCNTCAHP